MRGHRDLDVLQAGVFSQQGYLDTYPGALPRVKADALILQNARVFIVGNAPVVGGLGTVFGPVVGAFILTPLGEALVGLTEKFGINAPGAKAAFYGLALMIIIGLRPSGLWPGLARFLGLTEQRR